jgi:hypothetical protein
MEEERGGAVRHALGVHGVNEAKIVDLFRDLGKETGGVVAGLAMLRKLPERLENLFLLDLALAGVEEFDLLVVIREEGRLVVECIDLGGAALHEEEDDALGAGRMLAGTAVERAGRLCPLPGEETSQREVAEAAGGGLQEMTPGGLGAGEVAGLLVIWGIRQKSP